MTAHYIPSPPLTFQIRRATPDEAGVLTALAIRSKASWGYTPEFMERVRSILVVPAERIATQQVFAAEDSQGIAGFYELVATENPAVGWLESLFIEPRVIGTGCGRLLWQHAVQTARESGYTSVELESDPNAASFYRKMGAYLIGSVESTAQKGRMLPIMRFDLTQR